MKALHMVAFVLVLVGALNWGLVGLFNFNLVMVVLGSWPVVERLVYVLVGVSAVLLAWEHKAVCMYCSGKKK
ncbi:MAG: DUF378 domain-containing protein [Candidatus Levyibacteriota bacterium]